MQTNFNNICIAMFHKLYEKFKKKLRKCLKIPFKCMQTNFKKIII